jgi:hypothetical protein
VGSFAGSTYVSAQTRVFRYPLGHIHVRADLNEATPPKEFPKMHIGTGRVALEDVLWHLISEWDVLAKTGDWQTLLHDSREGFHQRRTAH